MRRLLGKTPAQTGIVLGEDAVFAENELPLMGCFGRLAPAYARGISGLEAGP